MVLNITNINGVILHLKLYVLKKIWVCFLLKEEKKRKERLYILLERTLKI